MNDTVIFLDIDGVMNSRKSSIRYFNKHIRPRGGRDKTPYNLAMGVEAPKKKMIKILNYIIDQTGADIVISSSWRTDFTNIGWNHYFYALGIKAHVAGQTDKLWTQRGLEIKKYLEDNPHIKHYVILDDDYDYAEEEIKNHWVRTRNADGLTEEDAVWAIEVIHRSKGIL